MAIPKSRWTIILVCLVSAFVIGVGLYFLHVPDSSIPKIAWLYWDKDTKTQLIQQIEDYNRSRLSGWDVRFLNARTMYDYVSPRDVPSGFKTLITQHQSDWLRLYLLRKYGGCWLDASIVFNDPAALDRIWTESQERASIFTGFATALQHTYKHSSGRVMPLVIDNWFIMAPPNSPVIELWYTEFEKAIQIGFLSYKRAAIRDGVDISAIYFKNDEDVYLTQHICIQKVFQKYIHDIPSILLLKSSDSMFAIQDKCKWDDVCIQNVFLNDPKTRELPYIKLIGGNRGMDLSSYFH